MVMTGIASFVYIMYKQGYY